MQRFRWRRTVVAALWLFGTPFLITPCVAQSDSNANSQIQQLYLDAKTAQAAGDRTAAISKYQDILKIAPHAPAVYNNLGMLYYEQHDLPQAAAVLQKGLKLDPNMVSAAALLGSVEFSMGQYDKARPYLETAVRKNPKDDFARTLLARDLFSLKDYAEAAAQLRVLIAAHPNDQQAWYLLGKSYLQLSESALAKVSQIDPNSALSKEIAGEIMQSLGNTNGALGAYKQAVDLAPNEPGTHEHLGNEYWLLGRWNSAREQFQDELANDPNDCQARWKMANALLEMHGDPAEALKELNQAISACPSLMQARVDRARAFLLQGQTARAVEDLTLAEMHSPDEPSIHFFLANAYRSEGRASEAHTEMQTYSRLKQAAMDNEAQKAAEDKSIRENAH